MAADGRRVNELATGVWSLGQKQGGHVHAFLLEAGGELTLVDTLYDTDGHRILEAISSLGHSPSDLRHIVLTHAHRSHLGGVAALKRASGARILAHEWEADIVAGEREAQRVTLVPHRPLRAYFPLQVGLALGLGKHPPCPPDATVEEQDAIGPLRVVYAPGHSPGHLAFVWPERRLLIAGDAVSTWPYLGAGWPAFNLNQAQHRESLRHLASFEPEVVCVGHGEPIQQGAADRLHEVAEAA